MNFDLSQFENLELDNVANWPPAAKLVLSVFFALVVLFVGYFVLVKDKMTQLSDAVAKEQQLKSDYKTKYGVVANIEKYRKNMEKADEEFKIQLEKLPESHETPGLLNDISFAGTTSGLDFVRLEWQPEISREIYIELPLNIEVIGKYHQFGEFVSKIAELPRIVTVHDFTIEPSNKSPEDLILKLAAKTYRYQEVSKP